MQTCEAGLKPLSCKCPPAGRDSGRRSAVFVRRLSPGGVYKKVPTLKCVKCDLRVCESVCVCERKREIERQAAEVKKKNRKRPVMDIKHQSSDIISYLIILLYNYNINYIDFMIKSYNYPFPFFIFPPAAKI